MYDLTRKKLDITYKIQDKTFKISQIKKDKLDAQTQNFLEIMKTLLENGYCTIREIAEKYNNPNEKKRIKNRHNIYHRIITGDEKENIEGLINKGIVEAEKPNWKDTRNNKFRLTIFGILYSIRLFSEPISFEEAKWQISKQLNRIKDDGIPRRTLIDKISKNYSSVLPLIFGKWENLKSESKNLDSILIFISHFAYMPVHLSEYPFFDSKPILFRKWKRESMLIADEFTILFLGHLYIFMRDDPKEFSRIISKDTEIYTFYEKYISILDDVQKLRQLIIKDVHYVLTNQFSKRDKLLEKILDIEGRSTNSEIIAKTMKGIKF